MFASPKIEYESGPLHIDLEYAIPVWDPHLCKDIDMLESV